MASTLTLAAPGERAVVSVEEAEATLDKWESDIAKAGDGAVVTTIDLSWRAWELSTLEVFRYLFSKHASTVTTLKIDDIIASLETSDGLASLGFFADVFKDSAVNDLNLNDNALGIRGIEVLRPLLQAPTVRKLYLENTGLSKESCTVLKEVLQPVALHLEAITLGRNALQADGAVIVGTLLQECPALQHFSYAGARPLVEGTGHICRGLATHASLPLVVLDLNDCTFKSGDEEDDAPVFALCETISKSANLKTLILRDGELTASGAERVLEALRTAGATLESLDMAANELEAEGVTAVMEYLVESASDTLHTLALDTNELGDEGIEVVAAELEKFKKLRVLKLGCNEIEEAGAQALIDHKVESLEVLDLEENFDIPHDAAKTLTNMYETVVVEQELLDGDEEEDADAAVDSLADALAESQI